MKLICIVLLAFTILSTMVRGTATASGGTVDLHLLAVQPIQVIQGVPLIIGKETVVRTTVAIKTVQGTGSISARLTLSFGGKVYSETVTFKPGAETTVLDIYPAPPDQLTPLEITARIDPLDGWTDISAENNVLAQPLIVDVVQQNSAKIRIVYIPVDWTSNDLTKLAGSSDYQAKLEKLMAEYASESSYFLQSAYPVISSSVVYSYTSIPHVLTPEIGRAHV